MASVVYFVFPEGGFEMRTFSRLFVIPLILVTTVPKLTLGQERHAVDPAAIANVISQHADQQDANRSSVREALARPEVRSAAARLGIDLHRLGQAIDTMSGDDLDRAAAAAQQVNERLVGGATISISTTTIIIALLLVILIIVAVD